MVVYNAHKSLLGVNVAGNGAAVHNLLLDVLVSDHSAVFGNGDLGVVLHGIAAVRRVAGHAGLNRTAVAIRGGVLLAGDVGNAVDVNPSHRCVDIAATA